MAIKQRDVNELPKCPVCGSYLVITPRGWVSCAENLEHTKLSLPADDDDIDAWKRIIAVVQLPIAERVSKKDGSLFCLSGDFTVYGRVRINDGHHWPGERIARIHSEGGWRRIRLVPFDKLADGKKSEVDSQKVMW